MSNSNNRFMIAPKQHNLAALLLLFFSFEIFAQLPFKPKLLHAFSLDYSNDVYFPEKVVRDYGPLYFKPFAKYSYSINFEYSFITKTGLGIQTGISHGFIPFGSFPNSEEVFTDSSIVNGEVGNPIMNFKDNMLDVPYLEFPVKVIYLQKVATNIFLIFKAGANLRNYPNYSVTGSSLGTGNIVVYARYEGKIDQKYQHFFPDLLLGVDLLWQPKKPNHFIKFGLKYNHNFVQRFPGTYWFANMGTEYNSGGKIFWGATYFGVSIGYHFMKYNKWQESKNQTNNYLFNPRM